MLPSDITFAHLQQVARMSADSRDRELCLKTLAEGLHISTPGDKVAFFVALAKLGALFVGAKRRAAVVGYGNAHCLGVADTHTISRPFAAQQC